MEQRETSRILTNVMDWKLEDSQINDKFHHEMLAIIFVQDTEEQLRKL